MTKRNSRLWRLPSRTLKNTLARARSCALVTIPKNGCDVISTSSIGIDMALGIGGIPRGRIIEIYGPESSGKTTLALHIVAEAQKNGGNAAFIDEHALGPHLCQGIGCGCGKSDHIPAGYGGTGNPGSPGPAAAPSTWPWWTRWQLWFPRRKRWGNGDSHVGLHARLMSQALRKLGGDY